MYITENRMHHDYCPNIKFLKDNVIAQNETLDWYVDILVNTHTVTQPVNGCDQQKTKQTVLKLSNQWHIEHHTNSAQIIQQHTDCQQISPQKTTNNQI